MSDEVILNIEDVTIRHANSKLDVEVAFKVIAPEFGELELNVLVDQVHSLDVAVETARKKVLSFAQGLQAASGRQFFEINQ